MENGTIYPRSAGYRQKAQYAETKKSPELRYQKGKRVGMPFAQAKEFPKKLFARVTFALGG